jgi:hypothetical protein
LSCPQCAPNPPHGIQQAPKWRSGAGRTSQIAAAPKMHPCGPGFWVEACSARDHRVRPERYGKKPASLRYHARTLGLHRGSIPYTLAICFGEMAANLCLLQLRQQRPAHAAVRQELDVCMSRAIERRCASVTPHHIRYDRAERLRSQAERSSQLAREAKNKGIVDVLLNLASQSLEQAADLERQSIQRRRRSSVPKLRFAENGLELDWMD